MPKTAAFKKHKTEKEGINLKIDMKNWRKGKNKTNEDIQRQQQE